jgi:protein-S-isoprenylcysteine O-methyltransferase Ste14
MIGREEPESSVHAGEAPPDGSKIAVQWGVGCLVGAAALAGVVLMVLLLAFYIQPPTWVQVVLGVALALGGALLAWLVATALGKSRAAERAPSGGERTGEPS